MRDAVDFHFESSEPKISGRSRRASGLLLACVRSAAALSRHATFPAARCFIWQASAKLGRKDKSMKMIIGLAMTLGLVLAFAGGASADLDGEADRIAERLDRRGDRIEEHLDRKGDRIDRRLDERGDRINDRLDRKAKLATEHGRDGLARRLDRKGDRIDRRLDRKGDRIDRRLDRRGARADRRLDRAQRRRDR
jgi:hypothetical protein